jgi:high-affinity nickel-transport protein
MFVVTWGLALAIWRIGRIEEKWSAGIRQARHPVVDLTD